MSDITRDTSVRCSEKIANRINEAAYKRFVPARLSSAKRKTEIKSGVRLR